MNLIGQIFQHGPNRLKVVGTYMGFTMCEVVDAADQRVSHELVALSKKEATKMMGGIR